ncbi:MAG: hypothetical protein ACOC44_10030 [Promethearchaeia archaeon]
MFERIKNIWKPKEKKGQETASVQDQVNDLLTRVGQHGVSFKLAQDIFSERKLSVHQEKAECKKAYNSVSYVQVAVNNLVNVILGDKPFINSENETIKSYAKEWKKLSKFGKAKKEAIQEAIITGDGYIRKLKGQNGNRKYKHIENSEDMYIDWDYQNNRPKRYIRRLYYTEAQAKREGIESFTLKTPYGLETIFGIEYDPSEIIRFKFMEHSFGVYGRSPIASILNDVDIIKRIERSIAVISMFKAIPQKILTPKDSGENTKTWNDKQIKQIEEQLKNQKDFESSIVGTPIESLNVTDSGQIIELTGYLDHFKRKISISLSPEFIIHGELVNRNTSTEQKQVYYLTVSAIREYFEDDIQEALEEGLNSSLEALREKGINLPYAQFWWEWGQYDIETREQKEERINRDWKEGLISHAEAREEKNYEPDETIGDQYSFDLISNPGQQVVEGLKNAIDNGNNKETEETNQKE